jgi:hypothetical protein
MLPNYVMAAILAGSGGGGGGVALPQIANLVTRFSADDIPAQADGSKVTSWTDGIAGVVAAQGTSANQPTYVASALGGKPGVAVNGTQWLSIASNGAMGTAMNSTDYTVLVVVSNVLTTSIGGFFGGQTSGTGHFYIANGTVAGRYDNTLLTSSVPFTGSGLVSFGSISVSTPPGSGPITRTAVGGSVVAQVPGVGPVLSATLVGIGASSGTGTFAGKGIIHEILVWNKGLNPAEVLQAEAWIRTKYGQALPWAGSTAFVLFDGDSQTADQGATAIKNGHTYLTAQSLGLALGQWTNSGVRGINLTNLNVKSSELAGFPTLLAGKRLVVAAFEYYNSKAQSGATNYALMQNYITTVGAQGTNTRFAIGSAFSSGSDPDANRLGAGSYCALLDATPLGSGYAQLHLLPHIGVSGGAAANPTYFLGDLIHLADLGHAELATAWTSPINAAIAAA